MKVRKRLFISCEEAAHRCDKFQYGEATEIEKLSIRLHALYCKFCKLYSRKNTRLSELLNKGKLIPLPSDRKEKMKAALQQKLMH